MVLTSNSELDIVKYEYNKSNKLTITCICSNCNLVIEKQLSLDKVTNIHCKGCGRTVCFIPLEINESTKRIIDFKLMTYYKVNKLLKSKEVARVLSKCTNKKDKEHLKLKLLRSYIMNSQSKNK